MKNGGTISYQICSISNLIALFCGSQRLLASSKDRKVVIQLLNDYRINLVNQFNPTLNLTFSHPVQVQIPGTGSTAHSSSLAMKKALKYSEMHCSEGVLSVN